jgi:hypothetical protein
MFEESEGALYKFCLDPDPDLIRTVFSNRLDPDPN